MKFQKIYTWPLHDAYKYSLIYADKKDPQDLTTEGLAYLFNYYNSQEKLEKQINFANGKKSLITHYQYENEKLVEIKKDFIETGGFCRDRYIHGENMIEKIKEVDGHLESRSVQLFNESSKLKEVQVYDNENQLESKEIFDEHGKIILIENSNAKNSIIKNEYDDKNNLILSRVCDEDNKLISEIRYSYLLDKLREQSFWENDQLIEKHLYHYSAEDKLKRLIRIVSEDNKEYETEYDSDESLIKTSVKIDGKQAFKWEKSFFDDMMAVLYLSTHFKYTQISQDSLQEIEISGKREVLLDDDKRIEAELFSNYTAVEDNENFQNDSYFTYEYGEE